MKHLDLSPDYGSSWGLWSNDPINPNIDAQMLTPQHFNLSPTLEKALREWLDQWKENYADASEEEANTWRQGFDKQAWSALGDAIIAAMQAELPGYEVTGTFHSYLDSPFR